MDTIFTILGCLLVSFIVSCIIFGIISSKGNKDNLDKSLLISTIIIGLVLFGLNYIYQSKISKIESLETEIEELKENNSNLEEKNDDLQSQLDNLQKEYDDSNELNDLLREQLESYGIEPDDL
jgi:hypothetical protein